MISNTKFWLLVAVSKPVTATSPAPLGTPLEARVPGPAASPPSHPVRHGLPGVHQDVDQLGDHSGVSSQVHEAGGSASVANTASPANPSSEKCQSRQILYCETSYNSPVDILLNLLGHLEVDDMSDVVDVQPTGSD